VENKALKNSLRDYIRILCYWKGTVIVLFLILTLTAAAVSFLLPPVYRAFTLVLVEREQRGPTLHQESRTAVLPSQLSVADEQAEVVQTQSEIIKSRLIIERVVKRFDLDKEFEEPDNIEQAIADLQERTRIKMKEETTIIRLSVDDNDPQMAADLANAIAEEYVGWIMEVKLKKTKEASETITERVGILDKDLKEAEDRLDQLKKGGGVAVLKDETELIVRKQADFNVEYENTIAAIAEKNARTQRLEEAIAKGEDLVAIEEVISNRVIDALKLRLLELDLKKKELSARYNQETALIESVNEEIVYAKEKLRLEIAKVIDSVITALRTDLAALEARKAALGNTRKDYSARLQQLSDIELEYRRLERQVAGKNELYMVLLGKQAEASLVEAIERTLLVNVKIIDPAKRPIKPVRPKKVLTTLLGCIVGVMCGMGGAFVKEYWDHSLKTTSEVRYYMELPALAAIPKVKRRYFGLAATGSAAYENFHALSASVQQSCKDRGINTLLVTSANRKEGKSIVAANLAASLASIEGKKVLAVDADMRQPTLHKFFEVKVRSNLVESLSRDGVIRADATDIPNLHLISTSEEVTEPSRVLAADSIRQFLKRVKSQYDYIIIDSPALMPYPDASILGFEAEGIIFVAKFGETKREVIDRAREMMDKSQRKILGIVLNGVRYVIPSLVYRLL